MACPIIRVLCVNPVLICGRCGATMFASSAFVVLYAGGPEHFYGSTSLRAVMLPSYDGEDRNS